MPEIAGKSISTNDAAVLGAGGLFIIFSFFPFYGFSGKFAEGFGIKASVSAWHYGIMVLALILMAVAVAVVAVRVFSSLPDMPVGPRLAALAAAGLAAVITVIRVLTLDKQSAGGVSIGPKFGAWAMLILAIVAAAFAFMAFRESGETMPTAGGNTAPPPVG
jgi:hypothetical protein